MRRLPELDQNLRDSHRLLLPDPGHDRDESATVNLGGHRPGEALAAANESGAESPAAVLAIRLILLTGARRGEALGYRCSLHRPTCAMIQSRYRCSSRCRRGLRKVPGDHGRRVGARVATSTIRMGLAARGGGMEAARWSPGEERIKALWLITSPRLHPCASCGPEDGIRLFSLCSC
jgi:hypothetical protein